MTDFIKGVKGFVGAALDPSNDHTLETFTRAQMLAEVDRRVERALLARAALAAKDSPQDQVGGFDLVAAVRELIVELDSEGYISPGAARRITQLEHDLDNFTPVPSVEAYVSSNPKTVFWQMQYGADKWCNMPEDWSPSKEKGKEDAVYRPLYVALPLPIYLTRYDVATSCYEGCMVEHQNGDYVLFEDVKNLLFGGAATPSSSPRCLEEAIRWCLDRDEKNGSLPEAYEDKLRAALLNSDRLNKSYEDTVIRQQNAIDRLREEITAIQEITLEMAAKVADADVPEGMAYGPGIGIASKIRLLISHGETPKSPLSNWHVIRQAFREGWNTNRYDAVDLPKGYLDGCEEADWQEFAKTIDPTPAAREGSNQ